MAAAKRQLQEVLCTVHNLRFAVDTDRLRELGYEPAVVGRCPVCTSAAIEEMHQTLIDAKGHRDLLLQAIDLKRTLLPQ